MTRSAVVSGSAGAADLGEVRRRSLTWWQLIVLLTMSHAPVIVLWLLIPSTFQFSRVSGTPIVYVLGGMLLGCAAIAYSGLVRRMQHPGGVYSLVAAGLGPATGLVVATVTVVAYIGLLASLLGLCGEVTVRAIQGMQGTKPPAVVAVAPIIVLLGLISRARLRRILTVMAGLLVLQIAGVAAFVVLVGRFPANGVVSWLGFHPGGLLTGSFGIALCFVMAGFMGLETGLNFSTEVRAPGRTLPRATYVAIGLTTVLVAVSAWAVSAGVGAEEVTSKLATESVDAAPPLLLSVITTALGPGSVGPANLIVLLVLLTGALGSSVILQQALARLLAGLSHDHVLSTRFGLPADGRSASPTSSWLIAVVTGLFAMGLLELENTAYSLWLTLACGLAISGTLTLLSIAVVVWFLRTDAEESGFFGWEGRVVAGALSAVVNCYVFVFGLLRLQSLFPRNTGLTWWSLPASLTIAAVAGLVLAAKLRISDRAAYRRIGDRRDAASFPPTAEWRSAETHRPKHRSRLEWGE